MTSLFSHSLLNDTDRDVRGNYRAFSRGTVHAALPGSGVNDRSSADVRPPRKNYAVVAKCPTRLRKKRSAKKAACYKLCYILINIGPQFCANPIKI